MTEPTPKASVRPSLAAGAPRPSSTKGLQPADRAASAKKPVDDQLKKDRDAVEAARARQQAARRGLVGQNDSESAPRESSSEPRARKKSPLVRLPIIIALVALLLAGAAVAGMQLHQDTSDLGVVRRQLMSWEFARDPTARELAVAPIDRMGGKGLQLVIELLADTRRAEIGSSHSDVTVQQLAASYLLHGAALVKVDPPPLALEVKGNIREGQPPTAAKWDELRKVWTAWFAEAQAKGAIKL